MTHDNTAIDSTAAADLLSLERGEGVDEFLLRFALEKLASTAWRKAEKTGQSRSDFQAAFAQSLRDGTIVPTPKAVRPKLSPLAKAVRKLARKEVTDNLRALGLKFPTSGRVVEFRDAQFTGEQLIDRRIAAHGARLEAEAQELLNPLPTSVEDLLAQL